MKMLFVLMLEYVISTLGFANVSMDIVELLANEVRFIFFKIFCIIRFDR